MPAGGARPASTTPRCETRRDFLKKSAAAALLGLSGVSRVRGQTSPPAANPPRWARLSTPYVQWARHQPEDAELTRIIQGAGVKISSDCPSISADRLEVLCAYRLIFTDHLAVVTDARQQDNLREYIDRGGFIYIDGCNDQTVTPSFRVFHEQHLAFLAHLLPGTEVRLLSQQHPIFQAPFPVDQRALIPDPEATDDPKWVGARQALYGIYDDNRLVVLLSQEHLRCAWGQVPQRTVLKQKLAANIHAYAMTR